MAPPLPLAASTNSELNLKAIFRPGHFWDASNNQRMASALPCLDPISIGTFRVDPFFYVLFLLLYWELLYVLLDVKPIVDFFLSFVESFSRFDTEFDKPMIFFRLS
ncbi:hypothetical protein VPH35_046993 [Triticum aestivum]|uniref:Uncharacterized protein n=1 Tax=Triticum aestivum TaxID=4565 RepID=A0A3B6ESR4_WHEAT